VSLEARANDTARYITVLAGTAMRERFVKFVQPGSEIYGERGALTYNGGLDAVPPVGSIVS